MSWRRIAGVVMLVLALVGSGGGPALVDAAQADATPSFAETVNQGTTVISISARQCDVLPAVDNSGDCHANSGIVINVWLASGEWIGSCTLGEPQQTPWGGELAGCGVDTIPFNSDIVVTQDASTIPAGYVPVNDPQTLHIGDQTPGGGDGTTFSFLNVLADSSSPPSGQTGQVTPVPAKGRGAQLRYGSCATGLTQAIADLSPVAKAQGEPVGHASAIEAEMSVTTIGVGLDGVIDGPSAIVVYASDAPDAQQIACGDIGGVNDGDGELIVMLQPVNNSGFAGTARLAYNLADASQTDITIYLGSIE